MIRLYHSDFQNMFCVYRFFHYAFNRHNELNSFQYKLGYSCMYFTGVNLIKLLQI